MVKKILYYCFPRLCKGKLLTWRSCDTGLYCRSFHVCHYYFCILQEVNDTDVPVPMPVPVKEPTGEVPELSTPIPEEQLKTTSKKKSSSSRTKSLTVGGNTDGESHVLATPISKSKSKKKIRTEINDTEVDDVSSTPSSKVAMPRILIRNTGSTSSKSAGARSKIPSIRSSGPKKGTIDKYSKMISVTLCSFVTF